jgi:hypothetical protein
MKTTKPTFQEVRNNFLHLVIFIFIVFLLGCDKQRNYTHSLSITDKIITKYLLDSTLQVLAKLAITKDTSYNEEDMYNRKMVEVSIQTIDSTKNRLAFIGIRETDTSYFQVFIFEVKKPKWKFLDTINDFYDNQLLPVAKLVDVDFDHKKDLLLTTQCLASRIVSRIDCFEFGADNFTVGRRKIAELYSSGIHGGNLDFSLDSLEKTIICYTDGGNFGTHEIRTYRWNNDTLELFNQLDEVYDDTFFIYHKKHFIKNGIELTNSTEFKEGDTIGYQIIHNEYELVNGVMKLTKRYIDF